VKEETKIIGGEINKFDFWNCKLWSIIVKLTFLNWGDFDRHIKKMVKV
jgi:hypothetical protein